MKMWKVALLITGLLMTSAVIGLAEEKAPAPCATTCATSCATTCAAVLCAATDDEKEIKVEITDDEDGKLIKVWEIIDGDDVLVKTIKADSETEALVKLQALDGLDDLHIMMMDDDDVFTINDGSRRKHLKKVVRKIDDSDMAFFVGPRAWLGVSMMNLSEQLGNYFDVKDGHGVLIEDVTEDSPADKSGLKAGDIIVKVGEKDVSDAGDVVDIVADQEIGDTVKIEVKRKGKTKTFEVELGERDADNFAWTHKSPKGLKHMKMLRDGGDRDIMFHEFRDEGLNKKIEDMRADIEELKATIEELREDRE